MAVTPRQSAAVLATRGSGASVRVLLALRSTKLRFFGGYWALPGGSVDPADREKPGERSSALPTTLEMARCGVRELFEETGLCAVDLDLGRAQDLRESLLGDDPAAALSFRELLDGAPEGLAKVQPIGTRTTPAMAPVRFTTRFLHVGLPLDAEPAVIEGELSDAEWVDPAEALRQWRTGQRLIVPPVLGILEKLVELGLEELLAAGPEVCSLDAAGASLGVRSTPGIAQLPLLTPTLPPATTTNCYVVGEGRLYVVDPATYDESERARLFESLDERVARGSRLEGALVTHHHPDHVGSVAATAERYDLPVFAHPLTLERLPEPVRDPRVLDEGSRLDLGDAPDGTPDWHLEAYHTPGHDRGHLVFRESRYGALIAGDLASTVSTILIEPPEGHLATYLESLRRMRDLDFGHLYPAHGPAARDGRALLERYLEHRAMRRRLLEQALAEHGPAEIGALVPHVYADTSPKLYALAEQSLLAGLEQLEEEGLAQRQGMGWLAS